jgi:cell division transport system permease protein
VIAVTVDERRPPDFAGLENRLEETVKGASLDTHRRWQVPLLRTAATLQRLSLAVLALIALSAAGLVVFATRSVLESNREVIDVLHMIGAKDRFIARSVKGRFLRSGFLAGLIGTCGGLMTFAVLGLVGAAGEGDALAEASARLLLAPPAVAAATYAVFLLVPMVATLLSVMTAHLAVMRQLRTVV